MKFKIMKTCLDFHLSVNEVEHLFMSLLTICVSFSIKYPLALFTNFSTGLFLFFLLICISASYILHTNPLSILCVAIIQPILILSFTVYSRHLLMNRNFQFYPCRICEWGLGDALDFLEDMSPVVILWDKILNLFAPQAGEVKRKLTRYK